MTIGGPTPGWEEGVFESAKFRSPQGMAFLPPCYLYVADTGNHSVRKVEYVEQTSSNSLNGGF